MGRFYQTAEPTFVDDAMFKAPHELQAQLLERKEKQVDDEIASAVTMLDKLQAEGLKADQPRLKEIIGGYEQKVNDIVSRIKENPMDYYKQNTAIRQLGRDINKDWTIGEVAGIQGNKKAYFDWTKNLDDEIKKNPKLYAAGQGDALKSAILNGYKGIGYDANTGNYNPLQTEEIAGMQDMTSFLKDVMDNAVQDTNTTVKWDNDKGQYRVKGEKTDKYYSKDQLQDLYSNALSTNPDLLAGLKQREKLQLDGFSGNFDANGQPVLAPGNYVAEGLDYMLNKYGGKETVRDSSKTYNKMWDAEYAYSMEKRKEQEETDYIDWAVNDVVTSFSGTDHVDFTERRNNIMKTIDNTKNEVSQIAVQNLGYKNIGDLKQRNPKLYNQIWVNGDFSSVKNTPQVKTLQREYDRVKLEMAGQQAMIKQFEKETGKSFKAVYSNPANRKLWDTFLQSKSQIPTDQKMSWEDMGVTQKQINNTAKTFVDSEQYKTAPIRFPKGTMIKGVDVGGKEYALNDLINAGLVINEPVKVPHLAKTGEAMTSKDGKQIAPATYEMQYKLADGTGSIGFSSAGSSIAPIIGYNDDGQVEMGFVVNMKGKNYIGRMNEMQTASTKEFNAKNGKRMRTRLTLQKYSGLDEVEIPNAGGAVYHGKDVFEKRDGKVFKKYSKGTITIPTGKGTKRTFNVNDPEVENTLSEWLYGED